MAIHRRAQSEPSEIDMTPMIDVVFQLIIFFIVTVKLDQDINQEIRLEESPHGPVIKEQPSAMVVEVDQRGRISIHNAQLTHEQFRNIMRSRFRRQGEFPVLIRGDYRTKHKDVRSVMDICTEVGIWRISFVAIKERKT